MNSSKVVCGTLSKHFIILLLLILISAITANVAAAKCTDSRIRNLSEDGGTIASIAAACEMTKRAIKDVLVDSKDVYRGPTNTTSAQLEIHQRGQNSGTPVGPCGCWGSVHPNHIQPHANCSSGYAKPRICNIPCAAGGFAWQGVCT